ncbi:peptidase G1 [Boletus reticuloceps]|uniref:Peptidase G1 n=1 Tax=Boletus reticuloceps TaxID=495285 RepID=A0A8I3ACS8_9AGAM|nr:peptidase G1 [Boletus reticuloceps]
MRFNSALFTTFLFASAVLAIRRRGSESRLLDLVEKATKATSGVEYTHNWAGAICRQDTGTIVMVSGVIAVPDMSTVEAGSVASAWVGIDGDTCKNAALMTGVVFGKTHNGPFYQAMYWSSPDTTETPENITISAGDVVRLTVGALAGPTVLQFTLVENFSNKQSAIKFQNHSQELCGQNAEWVVINYAEEGIPFPNFGTATFTDASALSEGLIFGPLEATILEIKQNGQVLTSVSVDNSSVTIKYL